jgi:hypothetical protein
MTLWCKASPPIYQDLALAPRLSIWENIFMGAELVRRVGPLSILDKRRMALDARGYLQRLSVPIEDMERPVERMSGVPAPGGRQSPARCAGTPASSSWTSPPPPWASRKPRWC